VSPSSKTLGSGEGQIRRRLGSRRRPPGCFGTRMFVSQNVEVDRKAAVSTGSASFVRRPALVHAVPEAAYLYLFSIAHRREITDAGASVGLSEARHSGLPQTFVDRLCLFVPSAKKNACTKKINGLAQKNVWVEKASPPLKNGRASNRRSLYDRSESAIALEAYEHGDLARVGGETLCRVQVE